MRSAGPWTPEMKSLAELLWHQGQSAREIAKRFPGTTRNAVIGILHRMKCAEGHVPVNRKRVLTPGPPNPPRVMVRRKPSPTVISFEAPGLTFFPTAEKWPAAAIPVLPTLKPPVRKHSKQIGILDVKGCRWPVGEGAVPGGHLFCNADRAGQGPYCAAHAAQAYGIGTPSERRAVKDGLWAGIERAR